MTRNNILILVAVGGLFYVGGQYVASQPQRVEQEVEAGREIQVTGRGEVTATPDIAQITLSVQTGVQKSAAIAIQQLTSKFDAVVKTVKLAGVADEDVKATNLSVQPRYDYTDGRQVLRGFEASESIQVKIRDLDSIGDVLARTVVDGVNQAGGLTFDIDDPDGLEQEAQDLAIKDAQDNAKALAKSLGVSLGRVKSFSANVSGGDPEPIFRATLLESADELAGPAVPAGSQDVVVHVSITYEIK